MTEPATVPLLIDTPAGGPATPSRSMSALGVEILNGLYQHRLMTSRQIQTLSAPGRSNRWVRYVLTRLRAAGVIDAVPAAQADRERIWFVTELGAELVEDAGQVLARPGFRPRPETAAGPLQAHTLGVNDIGLAFVRAARELGDECGPASWHHEWAARLADKQGSGGRWSNMITSDAVLRYLHRSPGGDHAAVRLIEYDRGYRDLEDVVAQLRGYAHYYRYVPGGARRPHWQDDYATFPRVLLVLDRLAPRALTTRRESLTWMCQDDRLLAQYAAPLGLLATTLAELSTHGPWAPIFWPLVPAAGQPPGPVTWTGAPRPPTLAAAQ